MILLATNVLSEPLRPQPDGAVTAWLDAQAHHTLYLCTPTIAEVRHGIALLPQGQRRDILATRFEREVLPLFPSRIVAFDEEATKHYARLSARAQQLGVALTAFDALIAACASQHGLTVATRDTCPFTAVGLAVINPFAAARPE